ncbi:MAG: AAA family ATPase, partial [Ilumatobacteraceae bacterium]
MSGVQFVGRDVELSAIANAIRAARDGGVSSVVWVQGAGGSGKSAIVRQVLETIGPDTSVRHVAAEEVAADVSFALVDQFGVDRSDGHPFSTGLALLELLTGTSGASSSLVVVEDLHWADPPSSQALLTAARRFDHDGVVLLVTCRPDVLSADDGWNRLLAEHPSVVRVDLGPLSVDEIAELVDRGGARVSPERAAELHAHTLGHPLHVQTLLDELPPEALSDTGGPLPVPMTVAASTIARIGELPTGSRSLAAALAVLNRSVPLATAAAVGELDAPTTALEGLLPSGVVSWEPSIAGTPVKFTHPLLRLAVYESLPPTVRQRMHRLAAEMGDEASSLSHRVASTDGFDDALADDLDRAALDELEHGRPSTAASQLLAASRCTSRRADANDRLLRAAQLFLQDGQTGRVVAIQDDIVRCRPSGRRSLVLGMLAWQRVDAVAAEEWLRLASSDEDREIAGAALALLGSIYAFHMRAADTIAAGEAIIALEVRDPVVEREGWWSVTLGESLANGPRAGLQRLAQRVPHDRADVVADDIDLLTLRAMMGCYASQIEQPLADLRATMASAAGRPGTRAHFHLAQSLHRAGSWSEAITHARVARSLAADMRQVWMLAQIEATLAQLLTERGDARGAEHFAAAQDVAAAVPTMEAVVTTAIVAGALAFVRFEPNGVIEHLQPLSDGDADGSISPMLPIGWWPTLVIAHLDKSDLAAARRERDRFVDAIARRGFPMPAPLADVDARIAWAERDPNALDALDAAVNLTDEEMPALERALLHQAYGEA